MNHLTFTHPYRNARSLVLCLLLIWTAFAGSCASTALAQDLETVQAIAERAKAPNWPNQRYLDGNRTYVLAFIRDALNVEGLTDAVLAEPHYLSPSTGARRSSLGRAADELMQLEDKVATGALANTRGIKLRIQQAITTWAVEMQGYYTAQRLGRVPSGLSAAIRLELRRRGQ